MKSLKTLIISISILAVCITYGGDFLHAIGAAELRGTVPYEGQPIYDLTAFMPPADAKAALQ